MRKRKIWQLQKCDREYAAGIAADLGVSPVAVSYTHLTLPTTSRV